MSLPQLLLVTDRHRMRPSFHGALEAALRGGARLIQLREKDLSPREVLALTLDAQRLCEAFGARLLINSRADIARAAHAAGVHLPENDLPPAEARLSLGHHALCGVSVHSVAIAVRAAAEGADYLVFGPIFHTTSHPNTAPAGLEMLQQVANSVACPVFAIGGITVELARTCRKAGAHGVAAISAVWSTPDVRTAVQSLLASTLES